MKKFVFAGILCFLVSLSFGQKKTVSAAKNEIKGNSPNIAEARALIKSALSNPETANDAETWYIAGQIENKQFDIEKAKEILGRQPNEEAMYNALEGIIPYFLKAAELDQLPDVKGKVKPRFLKDIRSIIKANRMYYINAAIFAYNNQNFQKAYENFKQYGDIPALNVFDDDKWVINKNDTTELQMRFYAGQSATRIPDSQAAIAIYSDMKDRGYVENNTFSEWEVYRELAREYDQANDSTAFEAIIKEGFGKFPSNEFFLFSMISLSVRSEKYEEAIDYLKKAVAQTPDNGQLYAYLGQLYFEDKKPDEAITNLKKSIELEPNNIDYLSELGRVYFNMGIDKRKSADEISDIAKSREATNEAIEFFKQAMPFFEKVFELDPSNKDAIFALRNIYYYLNMGPQFDKMDALFTGNE